MANLTHISSVPGLAGETQSVGLNSTSATQAAAARAAAAKLAAAKLAAARSASAHSGSGPAQVFRTVTKIVNNIPSSVWLAMAASLGLARYASPLPSCLAQSLGVMLVIRVHAKRRRASQRFII